MRRRRSSIAADSLDLLLDTITNTFGGILLLALLLVLLVRDSNAPTDKASDSGKSSPAKQKLVLQEQIAQLAAQRDVLKQSLAAQELFNSGEDHSQSQQMMQQLSQLLKQIGMTRADQVAQESLRGQLEKQIESQSSQLARLAADLTKRQSEVQAADVELQKEQSRRTHTMDLPKEQVTSKRMAVAVVKSNQLYLVQDNSGSDGFHYNSEHFKTSNRSAADVILSDGTCLSVISGNGVEMKADVLTNGMSGLDSNRVFLTIAIADDSFGTFAELRSSCVQLGLEYKVFPVSEFPIVEGPSSQLPRAQ